MKHLFQDWWGVDQAPATLVWKIRLLRKFGRKLNMRLRRHRQTTLVPGSNPQSSCTVSGENIHTHCLKCRLSREIRIRQDLNFGFFPNLLGISRYFFTFFFSTSFMDGPYPNKYVLTYIVCHVVCWLPKNFMWNFYSWFMTGTPNRNEPW